MSNYHLNVITDTDYERKIRTSVIRNHPYFSKYNPIFFKFSIMHLIVYRSTMKQLFTVKTSLLIRILSSHCNEETFFQKPCVIAICQLIKYWTAWRSLCLVEIFCLILRVININIKKYHTRLRMAWLGYRFKDRPAQCTDNALH